MLTEFGLVSNIFNLVKEFINHQKTDIMKKLAMVLALAFTMGLTASTVNASTTNDDKKKTEKKECTAEQKKSCGADKKACCSKDKKAETPAAPEKDKK